MIKKFLILCISISLYPLHSFCGYSDGFSDVVSKVYDGVVNISTTHKVKKRQIDDLFHRDFEDFIERFFNIEPDKSSPAEKSVSALGSGFVVDDSGIVVTNYHVIQGATEISVKFNDETSEKAKILGYDKNTDIAVLKINTNRKLTKISFGDSNKAKVGDCVLAIGNPFGFGGSVSAGIISAIARNINIGPFDDFIQTDAAINRGNSGGPLINMNGEVIGINTLIVSNSGANAGIGFAIPSSVAEYVVKKIISDGSVTRAWLGVLLQDVTEDISMYFKQEKKTGVMVAGVVPSSPAEKSGIQKGDLILEFDGKIIDNIRDLPKIVGYSKIGNKYPIVLLRNGKKMSIFVEVDKRPDTEQDEEEELMSEDRKKSVKIHDTEIIKGVVVKEISTVSSDIKHAYKIDTNVGLLITKVDPNSALYKNGLRQGQIIETVNNEKVLTIDDLKKQMSISKKEKKPLLLFVKFNLRDYSRFIAVPLN